MLRYAKSAHLTGVDVSEHQEKIDWAAVRAAGVDFAILRIGYRGYTEGSLREDSWFAENYTAARAAGVQVGVYFFSAGHDARGGPRGGRLHAGAA